MDDKHIVFDGEVQLKGWAIKHNTGAELAFWCADEADIERLKNMTTRKGKQAGQRLAMVLVEIGDDELPVVQPEPLENSERLDVKGGALAQKAGMLLSDPDFYAFVQSTGYDYLDPNNFILQRCGVNRKREIDHSPSARTEFMRMMTEFREWVQ